MGGYGGGFISMADLLDAPLTEEGARKLHSSLGPGVVALFLAHFAPWPRRLEWCAGCKAKVRASVVPVSTAWPIWPPVLKPWWTIRRCSGAMSNQSTTCATSLTAVGHVATPMA